MVKLNERSDEELRQQQLQEGLWQRLQHVSRTLIYQVLMRAGGEPFGAPYEIGVPSLTERAVKKFKQRGFFAFETLERTQVRRGRNKYTRYGASRYRGAYAGPEAARLPGRLAQLLAWLRAGVAAPARARRRGPRP